AEPCGARSRAISGGWWREREDANERSVADLCPRRNHGAVANEGATADARWRHGHPSALDAPCPQRRFVGDRASVSNLKEVGHHRGRRRKLDELSKLGAERAVPRRHIERRVKRPEGVVAERAELVHHPVPHVEPAVQRVSPGADTANEKPLEEDQLGRYEKNKRCA